MWQYENKSNFEMNIWQYIVKKSHCSIRFCIILTVICTELSLGMLTELWWLTILWFVSLGSVYTPSGAPLLTWFNLNPSTLSNHVPNKVWYEITYPFTNFNGCRDKQFNPTHYLSILRLKLIHISKTPCVIKSVAHWCMFLMVPGFV